MGREDRETVMSFLLYTKNIPTELYATKANSPLSLPVSSLHTSLLYERRSNKATERQKERYTACASSDTIREQRKNLAERVRDMDYSQQGYAGSYGTRRIVTRGRNHRVISRLTFFFGVVDFFLVESTNHPGTNSIPFIASFGNECFNKLCLGSF